MNKQKKILVAAISSIITAAVAIIVLVAIDRYEANRAERAVYDRMSAPGIKFEIKEINFIDNGAWGTVMLTSPKGEWKEYGFDANLIKKGFGEYDAEIKIPQYLRDEQELIKEEEARKDEELRFQAVDAAIERLARYKHETKEIFFEEKNGKITAIGEASLQNGFGAWKKYYVYAVLKKGTVGYDAEVDLTEK